MVIVPFPRLQPGDQLHCSFPDPWAPKKPNNSWLVDKNALVCMPPVLSKTEWEKKKALTSVSSSLTRGHFARCDGKQPIAL